MVNELTLEEAQAKVAALRADPELLQLYELADEVSKEQTLHDVGHADEVHDVACKLARQISALCPDLFDAWTLSVVIPAAAWLHDVGRSCDIDAHEIAGARIAYQYLTKHGFPKAVVLRICKIIAQHRSEFVLVHDFNDPAHAIVVIADKCVGDEDRVRWNRRLVLRFLRLFRATRLVHSPTVLKVIRALRLKWLIPLQEDWIHERVNFAIQEADVVVDGTGCKDAPGVIVLKIKLDLGTCQPQHMYNLYGKRLHACGKGAQLLKFQFRLEFNGERYRYSHSQETWVPVETIRIS